MRKIARGERNNNPGNIRHGSKWIGLCDKQLDAEFCQFISPEYGIRAIYKLLQTYQSKYKLDTVSKLINRYAPSHENNTQGYIVRVLNNTGIEKNKFINMNLQHVAIPIVIAIVDVELGYQPYSLDIFEKSWSLL